MSPFRAGSEKKSQISFTGMIKKVEHCPYSAIFVFKEKVIHCNLCKGDPECVQSCPAGALKMGA